MLDFKIKSIFLSLFSRFCIFLFFLINELVFYFIIRLDFFSFLTFSFFFFFLFFVSLFCLIIFFLKFFLNSFFFFSSNSFFILSSFFYSKILFSNIYVDIVNFFASMSLIVSTMILWLFFSRTFSLINCMLSNITT